MEDVFCLGQDLLSHLPPPARRYAHSPLTFPFYRLPNLSTRSGQGWHLNQRLCQKCRSCGASEWELHPSDGVSATPRLLGGQESKEPKLTLPPWPAVRSWAQGAVQTLSAIPSTHNYEELGLKDIRAASQEKSWLRARRSCQPAACQLPVFNEGG